MSRALVDHLARFPHSELFRIEELFGSWQAAQASPSPMAASSTRSPRHGRVRLFRLGPKRAAGCGGTANQQRQRSAAVWTGASQSRVSSSSRRVSVSEQPAISSEVV